MADSTRDPLSMDTVGGRGCRVAPAWPRRRFLFSQAQPLAGHPASSFISEETVKPRIARSPSPHLSLNHPLGLVSPPLPPTPSSAIPGIPDLVHPPHFLLTIYNGGHSLTDAGAIMKLRIKQSGLQKTQGSRVEPYTLIRPSHRLHRALET